MSKIQILDDTLASQVAAGEVVERPASVVKELVENSLDAEARHITVESQRGGTALVRVSDDGTGMSREDAMLSLERHATSKLKTSDQLSAISTLGFRGEAVPSIASVSRFRMSTRERGSVSGTEIRIDGGSLRDVRDAGGPEGTSIEAKQIFFNVPARRKFLRAETTESAHIEHQVRLHALAAPEVRFTLIRDGRTVFDLAGTSDWRVRIAGLAGSEAGSKLIEVKAHHSPGMSVRGYLLPPEYARKAKRQQYLFLNGRPIEDVAISRALRDGFRGAVQDGVHPAAWLWIDLDPSLVDVNVHPAKKEVRFHRPHEIRNRIAEAVELALRPASAMPDPGDRAESSSVFSGGAIPIDEVSHPVEKSQETVKPEGRPTGLERADCAVPSDPISGAERNERFDPLVGAGLLHGREQQEEFTDEKGEQIGQRPEFQLIGALHARYVLLQGEDGLVLLDPAAARERIVYEDLLRAGESEVAVRSQGLLVPEVLELDILDAELVMRHVGHFADAGMVVEPFGGNSVKVSSVPSFLELSDIHSFLLEVVDELQETVGTRKGKSLAFEVFAAGLARRIGRHEVCRVKHAESLLDSLFACDLPYCTPEGRPTLIQLALSELDRKFGK